MDKNQYALQKLTHRKTGYPMGTIAYYGPDDKFASKVVVGILDSPKDKEAKRLRKWFSNGEVDVRYDATILLEMTEYILQENSRRIVTMDRIIGCPHEEGVDYPMGETCPQCPFWANRDRWTGEIIS